jgi:hypothetical protein
MDYSLEIRPLSEAETDSVSGAGYVPTLYYYNLMREAGFTKNPATELAPEYRTSLLSPSGPQPPAIFG